MYFIDDNTWARKRKNLDDGLDENMIMWDSSDNPYYYFHDGLGSVRNILDANGQEKNSYDYKAFGEALGTPTETVDNRYGYTGREKDADDHYYYRARYYRPSQGRFGSTDPVTSSNLYVYVNNRPTYYIDSKGEEPEYCKCLNTTIKQRWSETVFSWKWGFIPDLVKNFYERTIQDGSTVNIFKTDLLNFTFSFDGTTPLNVLVWAEYDTNIGSLHVFKTPEYKIDLLFNNEYDRATLLPPNSISKFRDDVFEVGNYRWSYPGGFTFDSKGGINVKVFIFDTDTQECNAATATKYTSIPVQFKNYKCNKEYNILFGTMNLNPPAATKATTAGSSSNQTSPSKNSSKSSHKTPTQEELNKWKKLYGQDDQGNWQ